MSDVLALPKPYLVVLALFELGGEADLEHVAVKAFELFPGLFTWKSFPEYPDKDVVRVSLSDAKKATFGRLVTDKDLRGEGDRSHGRSKRYALTRAGLEKARELRSGLKGRLAVAQPTGLEFRRVIEPITKSQGYQRFRQGEPLSSIGRQAFLESFKLFPDATDFIISGRLARAERLLDGVPDGEERDLLARYLGDGRATFEL